MVESRDSSRMEEEEEEGGNPPTILMRSADYPAGELCVERRWRPSDASRVYICICQVETEGCPYIPESVFCRDFLSLGVL